MRKLSVSIALAASLALAAVAMADNSHEILSASGTPRGKGTPAKPVPKTLKMTFEIKNADDPSQRPLQTQRFSLAAEGVVDFGKRFPKCTFSQATQQSLAAVKRACGTARVGGGLARNLAGAANETSIATSLSCNLSMNFYNLGSGAALRLDGDPPASPPSSDAPGCVISIHTSIRVRYAPIKVDGVRSTALRFTVPDELLEPITGVLNSVIGARFTITSKIRSVRIRGKLRKVKIGSAIGCNGRTRTALVDFTDVQGNTRRAEKEVPC
jgi:hypothetical protein